MHQLHLRELIMTFIYTRRVVKGTLQPLLRMHTMAHLYDGMSVYLHHYCIKHLLNEPLVM